MILDIRTLIFLTAIYGFILGLVMIIFWKTKQHSKGFVNIGIGYQTFGLGYLLLGYSQILPDFLAIVLANWSILFGLLLISYGLKRLYEINRNWILIDTIFMIILFVGYIILTFYYVDINLRIIFVTIIELFYFIRIAMISLLPSKINNKIPRYIIGIFFGLLALYNIFRIIATYNGGTIDSFMNTGFVQAISIVIYQFIAVIVMIGSFWYSNNLVEELLMVQATTDSLTGIKNRGYFIETAIKLTSRKSVWGLAVFDIDHFKKINDTFGHTVGDQVLIKFCQILSSYESEDCIVGRYGGEEFLMLKKLNPHENWENILNAVRNSVMNTPINSGKISINLTVSAGGIVIKNEIFNQSYIDTADKFLYQAKDQGRNKVIIAQR